MLRTYSRKPTRRQSPVSLDDSLDDASESSSPTQVPKRRKIVMEVIQESIPDTRSGANSRGTQVTLEPRTSTAIAREHTLSGKSKKIKEISAPQNPVRASPQATTLECGEESKYFTRGSPIRQYESHPNFDLSKSSLQRSTTLPALPVSAPHTPKRLSKEPTQLIDTYSTQSPATTPKLAKRMLSRSRTESSLRSGNTSGSSSVASFQEVTFKDFRKNHVERRPLPQILPPSGPAQASVSNARTYAGKSRSFLASIPTAAHNSTTEDHEDAEDSIETRESYTALRNRWGVDVLEDDPFPPLSSQASPDRGHKQRQGRGTPIPPPEIATYPNGMMNDLKSITELRSKGESRRFLDEVGYLFEGLDQNCAISLRRASALELVKNLCDGEFLRKAKVGGFLGRAWDVLREAGSGTGDKVLDAVLCFFAALVAHDTQSISELAGKSDFIPTLSDMLAEITSGDDSLGLIDSGSGDRDLKNARISRTEKVQLTALHGFIVRKSTVLEKGSAVSTRLLIVKALGAVSPLTLDSKCIGAVRHSLRLELQLFPPCIHAYLTVASRELPPSSPIDRPSFVHAHSCLQILDSFLLGQCSFGPDEELAHRRALEVDEVAEMADGLLSLCVLAELGDTQSAESHSMMPKCTEMACRVLLSLSHENRAWCHAILHHALALSYIMRTILKAHILLAASPREISHSSTLSSQDEHYAQALDSMCLAVGLLTHLVQMEDEAKDMTRQIRVNAQCKPQNACIKNCQCLEHLDGLQCLILVYQRQHQEDDQKDPAESFLRGHLAVLFGLLIQGNEANQAILLATLDVSVLVDQAREFITFHADLTSRLTHAGPQREKTSQALEASQDASNSDAETYTYLGNREGFAQGILAFLETLIDNNVRAS